MLSVPKEQQLFRCCFQGDEWVNQEDKTQTPFHRFLKGCVFLALVCVIPLAGLLALVTFSVFYFRCTPLPFCFQASPIFHQWRNVKLKPTSKLLLKILAVSYDSPGVYLQTSLESVLIRLNKLLWLFQAVWPGIGLHMGKTKRSR